MQLHATPKTCREKEKKEVGSEAGYVPEEDFKRESSQSSIVRKSRSTPTELRKVCQKKSICTSAARAFLISAGKSQDSVLHVKLHRAQLRIQHPAASEPRLCSDAVLR